MSEAHEGQACHGPGYASPEEAGAEAGPREGSNTPDRRSAFAGLRTCAFKRRTACYFGGFLSSSDGSGSSPASKSSDSTTRASRSAP